MERLTVLVADDSPVIHQLFRNALRDSDAKVLHAFSSAEFTQAFDDHGVDLAFLDVYMPQMSGVEALWGARNQGNKTFVTLITGQRNKRCVEIARQLEVYELLVKPFGIDDIRNVLETFRRISTPMRALIVDDSEITRKITRKVLSRSIFRLEIADTASGTEALARCETEPFDIIFLDCNMPDMNGLETLARLRRDNPHMNVVMISGEHDAMREREAMKLGAVAFMHKPFFPDDIDAVVHQVLGLHSPRLTMDTHVRDFGIKIYGRTIAVQHQGTGHSYQYVWFRDPPHLRLPSIRENPAAATPAHEVKSHAEKAAVLELRNASLLNCASHS